MSRARSVGLSVPVHSAALSRRRTTLTNNEKPEPPGRDWTTRMIWRNESIRALYSSQTLVDRLLRLSFTPVVQRGFISSEGRVVLLLVKLCHEFLSRRQQGKV